MQPMRTRFCAGFLLVFWLLLAGACSYEYVPDAQGTPRPVLRFSGEASSLAPAQSASPAAASAPSTPTAVASGKPQSTPTAQPQASRPVLKRLTEPGCCSGIWWSADGRKVLFVDKPDERDAAIWGVDTVSGERAPYSSVVGILQHNDRYIIVPQHRTPQSATLHDRETGESWGLIDVGLLPFIAPDGTQLAYDGRSTHLPRSVNRRQAPIVVADLDGSNPRFLNSIYGGGIIDWFPDGSRLLVVGTLTEGRQLPALWLVDVATGAIEKLVDSAFMRNISLSPDGAWVAFLTLFEEDTELNTTWAVNVHTGERRRLDFVGAYAWVEAEGNTLVYVPARDAPDVGFAVWKLNVATGERIGLVDPKQTPLFIANGDWALAPAGQRLAFVSAKDYAIWLLEFNP